MPQLMSPLRTQTLTLQELHEVQLAHDGPVPPQAVLDKIAQRGRVTTPRPMSTASARAFARELRNQSGIHAKNANSCLIAIRAVTKQRSVCTDPERCIALDKRSNELSKRYDAFIADSRSYAAQADVLEEQLRSVEGAGELIQSQAAE